MWERGALKDGSPYVYGSKETVEYDSPIRSHRKGIRKLGKGKINSFLRSHGKGVLKLGNVERRHSSVVGSHTKGTRKRGKQWKTSLLLGAIITRALLRLERTMNLLCH